MPLNGCVVAGGSGAQARDSDSTLSQLTVLAYPARIQSNLNNAARIFLEDLKADLNFSCENPVVITYDLPEPNSWMALESFFALEGNHPYDPIDIFCGGIHLMIPESTLIGRIVLANLFSTMSDAFCDGRSWNGEWGLPDVLVNRKLEVEIARPYCERTTINTIQNDLTRAATNYFFLHLDSSLRVFSSKYSMTKLREFCNFIASHPALKSALANLALIDGIYSVNQPVSWRAKKLLESVINVPNPFSDWRKIFMDEHYLVDNSVVPPVLTSVWEHAKKKMQDISENNPSEVAAGIHKENEPCFGENIAGEGNPEDKSMLPFDGTAGDGLKIQRH
ncbi:hypothetical protein C2845_PM16G21260 [Panicum miliaceum]|uniref:Uncharacterized protein n=1 Tax=Panicum miliaceum TaxID=4540 RepID=A0A3L6PVY6_PANMI|nr:hypothetical protein C2845_PM16G21260 [Panicum miliaceum]